MAKVLRLLPELAAQPLKLFHNLKGRWGMQGCLTHIDWWFGNLGHDAGWFRGAFDGLLMSAILKGGIAVVTV
ncbi:hypothetical protein J4E08_05310 [Sagittula sp. NFXS13]|uniref:hypothetical protein n=1 Tax=Sagittula sp. NFXS13 TaxID=2819095 RepID=UPI0032DFCE3E